MDLTANTAEVYLRHAFGQMLTVADRLGDEQVNERPLGPHTNAVAALIVHCCAVSEYWLGHVGLGRSSDRNRKSEFSRRASVEELHRLIAATIDQAVADIAELDAGAGQEHHWRSSLPGGDTSDTSIVLHVIEEVFQHLGHMELAVDALLREAP